MNNIEMYVVLYLDIMVFGICYFIYTQVLTTKEGRQAKRGALKKFVTVFIPFYILKKYYNKKRRVTRRVKNIKNGIVSKVYTRFGRQH